MRYNTPSCPAQLSHSISLLRFPLVLAIILLHGVTATEFPPESHHDAFNLTLYPLAFWIGDTGVPAYFFISGLLLFYSSKTYFQQIKRRTRTLLVPYLLWNGAYLLLYVAFWLAGHEQLINSRSLSDYVWTDYLRAFWDRGEWLGGDSMPILTPMWYIRNLILMYLVSPLVYYAIRYTRLLLPLALTAVWVNTHSVAFTWQSMSLFCLGAYFPIAGINPLSLIREHKKALILLFVVLALADNVLHIFYPFMPYNLQLHRLSLLANVFFALGLGVWLWERGLRLRRLTHAAFFIFCVHYPINSFIRKSITAHGEWSDGTHIVLYFLSVALVVAVSMALYTLLHRFAPAVLRLLTGNRD